MNLNKTTPVFERDPRCKFLLFIHHWASENEKLSLIYIDTVTSKLARILGKVGVLKLLQSSNSNSEKYIIQPIVGKFRQRNVLLFPLFPVFFR